FKQRSGCSLIQLFCQFSCFLSKCFKKRARCTVIRYHLLYLSLLISYYACHTLLAVSYCVIFHLVFKLFACYLIKPFISLYVSLIRSYIFSKLFYHPIKLLVSSSVLNT